MSNIGNSRSAGFSPEAVVSINRAYEAALKSLGGVDFHADSRARLGRCVMELAAAGELDERRLRDRALAMLAQPDQLSLRQAAQPGAAHISVDRTTSKVYSIMNPTSRLDMLSTAHTGGSSHMHHTDTP